jgi:hypothetical protein
MTTLTTTALSTEVLEDTLLALNTSRNPQQSPRFRTLLGDLAVLIQECEDDLGTYTLS